MLTVYYLLLTEYLIDIWIYGYIFFTLVHLGATRYELILHKAMTRMVRYNLTAKLLRKSFSYFILPHSNLVGCLAVQGQGCIQLYGPLGKRAKGWRGGRWGGKGEEGEWGRRDIRCRIFFFKLYLYHICLKSICELDTHCSTQKFNSEKSKCVLFG